MIYVVLIFTIILGVFFILKDKPQKDNSFNSIFNQGVHLKTIMFTIGCVIILIILLLSDCSRL